jgi:hypothetical protein
VLDTTALTRASSANADLLAGLEQHDRTRREAAIERLQHSVPEFEMAAGEVLAATRALVSSTKSRATELGEEEIERRLAAFDSLEQTFALLLGTKRSLHKRVLSFLSERDRASFNLVKPFVARDEEASVRVCEALRDARWTFMAVLADLSPPEQTVEVSSAADIRRALIGG